MNMRIWGCKDARIQASTHKHKYKDMSMSRCENISKRTGTLGYKDVRMQGHKQVKDINYLGYS